MAFLGKIGKKTVQSLLLDEHYNIAVWLANIYEQRIDSLSTVDCSALGHTQSLLTVAASYRSGGANTELSCRFDGLLPETTNRTPADNGID